MFCDRDVAGGLNADLVRWWLRLCVERHAAGGTWGPECSHGDAGWRNTEGVSLSKGFCSAGPWPDMEGLRLRLMNMARR